QKPMNQWVLVLGSDANTNGCIGSVFDSAAASTWDQRQVDAGAADALEVRPHHHFQLALIGGQADLTGHANAGTLNGRDRRLIDRRGRGLLGYGAWRVGAGSAGAAAEAAARGEVRRGDGPQLAQDVAGRQQALLLGFLRLRGGGRRHRGHLRAPAIGQVELDRFGAVQMDRLDAAGFLAGADVLDDLQPGAAPQRLAPVAPDRDLILAGEALGRRVGDLVVAERGPHEDAAAGRLLLRGRADGTAR